MALQVEMLRSSFRQMIEREPELTVRFYEKLFARYPQVRPLFGASSQKRQAEMLAGALVALMDHLENPAWLVSTLPPLGAKHVGYGVTDEMYGWVGECLLAAMADASDDWTPELAAAWTEAYGAVADLMLQGARARRMRRRSGEHAAVRPSGEIPMQRE